MLYLRSSKGGRNDAVGHKDGPPDSVSLLAVQSRHMRIQFETIAVQTQMLRHTDRQADIDPRFVAPTCSHLLKSQEDKSAHTVQIRLVVEGVQYHLGLF